MEIRGSTSEPAAATATLPAWMAPAIIAGAAVAILGGFYLGGPGLGMAIGALAAATIVLVAVRMVPRGPIVPAALADLRRHLLLVSRWPLEDPEALHQIAALCADGGPDGEGSEVRVLTPRRRGLLDRWSGERLAAQARAQRDCVISLAALGAAGVAATAAVGDEDVVLAVEDELRTFPATDVILLTRAGERDGDEIAAELRMRLRTDFLHLELGAASVSGGAEKRSLGEPQRRRR